MATPLTHADMEYFGNISALQFANDLIQSITSNGSLRINRFSTTPLNLIGNFQPKITSAPTQGLPTARLRMSVRGVVISDNDQHVGLMCMMSQRNMSSGVQGQAYYWRYTLRNGTLQLGQFVSGINSTPIVFSTVSAHNISAALQLSWDLASDSSRITLRGYIGNQQNFSDLSQMVSHVDTTPLTATVTEGGFYQETGSGRDVSLLVDNLELLPLES